MSEQPKRATLEGLIERQQLYDLLVQHWCLAIDTLDWKLLRSLYADEVEVNMQSPSLPHNPPPKMWKSDEWLTYAGGRPSTGTTGRIPGFDRTSHSLTNFVYDVNGDTAVVKSYLLSDHLLDKECYTVAGQYTHGFKRTPDGWKINRLRLEVWWTKGDPDLFKRAGERATNNTASRKPKSTF